jgi:hypothetical protein
LRESTQLTHWSENPAISDFLGRMRLAAFTSMVAGALMNWITAVSENHGRKALLLLSGMLSLLMASPAPAKLATDFDPNLDNPTGERDNFRVPLIRPSEIHHEGDSLPKAFATVLGAFNGACVRPLICRPL